MLRSGFEQLWRIFGEDGRTYEVVEPLRLGDQNFGTINIGVSTLLIRKDLEERLQPVLVTALWVLGVAIAGALGLAQWLLRPIHVLRSGLRQLERGEPAAIELPQDEFGDLGREIKAVSDKLLAERAAPEGPQAGLRFDRRAPGRRRRHLRSWRRVAVCQPDAAGAAEGVGALRAVCRHRRSRRASRAPRPTR